MAVERRRLKSKIRSPGSLARHLARLRRTNTKTIIVFTNGCFDLLHKGHVSYLEKARGLGTHLVVALNGDQSVRRLKGPTRPMNKLADRLEVIAALESVDFVTWFESDTPLDLIESLSPNILVKGGDWNPLQIVGADHVLARGGKVRSLAYVDGHSTTQMIKRAQSSR